MTIIALSIKKQMGIVNENGRLCIKIIAECRRIKKSPVLGLRPGIFICLLIFNLMCVL